MAKKGLLRLTGGGHPPSLAPAGPELLTPKTSRGFVEHAGPNRRRRAPASAKFAASKPFFAPVTRLQRAENPFGERTRGLSDTPEPSWRADGL
jgi:hypothetical protein